VLVLSAGVAAFAAAYALFAASGASILVLAVPFVLAAWASEPWRPPSIPPWRRSPTDLRGSAFGLLATIQAAGNLAASAVAGALWTGVSARAAFIYLAVWMLHALIGLLATMRR
jgi:hypothetical protein